MNLPFRYEIEDHRLRWWPILEVPWTYHSGSWYTHRRCFSFFTVPLKME
jgi:hypothetical protein